MTERLAAKVNVLSVVVVSDMRFYGDESNIVVKWNASEISEGAHCIAKSLLP